MATAATTTSSTSTSTSTSTASSKALHYGLWVVQGMLAFAFGMAGMMKMGTSPADLVASGMAWAGRMPAGLVLFIGLSEFLGAVGLVLPSALRIQPKLTAAAAAGLVIVMVLAAGEHAMAAEFSAIPVNVVLGSMAAFVAWGRLKASPIAAR